MNININDNDLLNAIFMEEKNMYSLKLRPILDISQPIILEFNYLEETYLIYVLQDRTACVNNKLIEIKELLISKTNTNVISKLVKSEMSIYDSFLSSKDIWRIGQIDNKIYPRKELQLIDEIADRFSKQNVFLKEIPNKINLNSLIQ